MRRSALWTGVLAGVVAIGFAVPALAGTANGNGAQKSALSQASNSSGNCSSGSGTSNNGWAILNKTGAPVTGTSTVQGEVHIVDPTLEGQTVMAFVVSPGSMSCMSAAMTTITLNGQGIGNGHLSGMEVNGSYYVAVTNNTGTEVLASQPVTLL